MNKLQAQLAKGGVRIRFTFQGEEHESTHYRSCITIGRAHDASSPDVDLSPDTNVSRNHARVWVDEEKNCWIEDLGSKFGTRVDGEPIGGKGRVRIDSTKRLQVGDTIVTVEPLGTGLGGFAELAPQPLMPSTIEIGKTISNVNPRSPLEASTLDASQRQAMLLEILVQFSLPARLDQLMQTITTRVVELVPGARRGTLLLRNPETNRLVLAAFVSPAGPAVSETLARRALDQQEAFVWRNTFGYDPAASIQRHQIQSGMYAPLVYDGRALGVLCVDNPNTHAAFSEDDLQLLVAVADHAAVAVHNQQTQETLQSRIRALEGLVWNFSTQTRTSLVEKALGGRFAPGLKKADLSVLAVSFRDLGVKLSVIPAREGSQMVAHYTEAVARCIFEFQGAFCADCGDGFMAVFGAPERQGDPHRNALQAAEAMRAALNDINRRRSAAEEPTCDFGIAVTCGAVVHGFTEVAGRLQFKVLGKPLQQAREQSEAATAEMVVSEQLQRRAERKAA